MSFCRTFRNFPSVAVLAGFLLYANGAVAQEPDDGPQSFESFESRLSTLTARMQELEDQNLALQDELTELRNSNAGRASLVSDEPQDAESQDQPQSYDDALKLSRETNQRLDQLVAELEAEATKDAEAAQKKKAEDAKREKKWYDKYTIRGYAQFRLNQVFDNESPARPQHVGDSSVGDDQSFLIRRARLILSGDVSEHVSLYFQPDFASNVPGSSDSNQFAQIRDLYADVFLDDQKELRFRVGQSKIPYGWENLQSSSNRLPLDRNDGLNTAARNERDLGIFLYWTPKEVQDILKYVMDDGLKGSGNYGMFGVGVYNGQGGSFREQNDNMHAIARFTYPFWLNDCQLMEVSMQGYTGQYTVLSSPISPLGVGPAVRPQGTLETNGQEGILDERLAWTLIYYPQPLGFQAEWNIGRGPALNDAQTRVTDSSITGGYAMMMYRQKLDKGELWPFARWNYYNGGYKTERNAPMSQIQEWDIGTEWQFSKSLELVAMYSITDRTNTTAQSAANTLSYEQFEGSMLRFQVQVNY
ncbi:MAG: porin [Planctomycetaceae bacterium]|nr:porin [Planctomycetaceae bacterium]